MCFLPGKKHLFALTSTWSHPAGRFPNQKNQPTNQASKQATNQATNQANNQQGKLSDFCTQIFEMANF